MGPSISVVIRTRNEIAWIAQCITAVKLQRADRTEIVVVDNGSTDGTPELVRKLGCKVVDISPTQFTFGRALNWGIAASSEEYIGILSGHCIPSNEMWLCRLRSCFEVEGVVGAYGAQEPLPDSHDFDKRDLWTTFPIERRFQKKDFFFHNANSMILRSVWDQYPFDEELEGLEDRAWAKKVIASGATIAYEPQARVYHHHGIHQGRDEMRAERVVRVIELIKHDR